MWKNIGLVLVVLLLMFVMRPRFFMGFFENMKGKDYSLDSLGQPKYKLDGKRRHGPATDAKYAPGYSAENFKGDAYQFPGDTAKPKSVGGLWDELLKLKFDSQFDKEFGEVIWKPKLTEQIKKLDNQEINLKGYIIPIDVKGGAFMLSAYPVAQCFFCGGAGPESVAEVEPTTPVEQTEELIEVRGKLHLNTTDQQHMTYILKNAKLVKVGR